MVISNFQVKSLIVAREQHELELQLVEEGDQPEACFLQEALALLQARQDSLGESITPDNPSFSLEEGIEAVSLSSPEEPSSSESLSSFEEVLSPLSPVAGEAGAVLDEQQPQNQEVEQPQSTITVQDLDISQLQPVNTINPGGQVYIYHFPIVTKFTGVHIVSSTVLDVLCICGLCALWGITKWISF